jgi:uncharacterized membrane protein
VISQQDRTIWRLVALEACAIAFVYYTCGLLPRVVASHFNGAGVATGFMPRAMYERIAIAIVLLPPVFLAVLPRLSLRNPNARINVPNREYWLAPERRAETVAIIAGACTRFAEMLIVFLCYAHWLVVRANGSTPSTLSSGWFLAGLVVFLAVVVWWTSRMVARFRLEH